MYIGLRDKYVLFLSDIKKKLELYGQIFDKYSDMEFNENPSSGGPSCSMRTDGQTTDVTKLIVTFRNFANAPNKNEHNVTGKDDTAICALTFKNRASYI